VVLPYQRFLDLGGMQWVGHERAGRDQRKRRRLER
jgi:hypothetical protein